MPGGLAPDKDGIGWVYAECSSAEQGAEWNFKASRPRPHHNGRGIQAEAASRLGSDEGFCISSA